VAPSLIRPDKTGVKCGLMREDVQKTEDKVPIIGDIPLIGRAFRTNVDQHIKKNLVIFVTARIVTPAGLPLNRRRGRPAPAGVVGSSRVQEVTTN
jgi:type II secretory pathway component GspD/PulD (secretin)